MMIFDGVATKAPPVGPKMQGFLGVVSLLATTMMAAEQSRKERVAKAQHAPSELEDVMAQSGLSIPAMHDVLVTIMGGSEEAKQAAALITSCPDPSKLLQKFAQTFTFGQAANTAPIVTPPPTAPSQAAFGGLPTFRPDFTREARDAAKAAGDPATAPLPTYRADFTRESREAAMNPPPSAATDAPLIRALERRLGVMRQKVKQDMAALEARIGQAEAVLAALRAELQELRARKATQTTSFSPSVEAAAEAAPPDTTVVQTAATTSQPETDPTPIVAAVEMAEPPVDDTSETSASVPVVAASELSETTSSGSVELDTSPPLPAPVSEAEGHRAAALLDEFADEVEAQHQAAMRRVVAIENEATAMRALIQQERESGADAHG